ncbi:Methylated-DNA--protein-cysteine methyltransferase [Thermoflexales bacterium]|nr:Methylated-DNA--protein-cysteine methyltransferase [Thermoflexales bacterium]
MTPEFEWDKKVLKALDAVYAAPSALATKQAQAKLRRALMAAKGKIVYYGYAPRTRVGSLFVAVNDRGLVALDFGLSEQEFVARVSHRMRATLIRSDDAVAEAMKQVKEYLEGQRTKFDLPLDFSTMSEFQRRVLTIALKIPRGKYLTYGEVAKAIGKPQASRAVGQALGHNPVPIVIPCHRVLGSDGSLHGYSGGGGLQTKAWLLQLEGASIPVSTE